MTSRVIDSTGEMPRLLFDRIRRSNYHRGDADFTVTELIQPSKIWSLKKEHKDEIRSEADSLLLAMMGSAFHEYMADQIGYSASWYSERRLRRKLSSGVTVSGQVDAYDLNECILWDFKTCSVWSAKDDKVKPDWQFQLSAYAWLLEWELFGNPAPSPVADLRVMAIYRDWRKAESRRYDWYPNAPYKVIKVPLLNDIGERIEARIKSHNDALIDAQGTYCTREERWSQPDKFAVYSKPGMKRPMRVFDSPKEAAELASKAEQRFVIKRIGRDTRCEEYCSVSQWCEQFNNNPETEGDELPF